MKGAVRNKFTTFPLQNPRIPSFNIISSIIRITFCRAPRTMYSSLSLSNGATNDLQRYSGYSKCHSVTIYLSTEAYFFSCPTQPWNTLEEDNLAWTLEIFYSQCFILFVHNENVSHSLIHVYVAQVYTDKEINSALINLYSKSSPSSLHIGVTLLALQIFPS